MVLGVVDGEDRSKEEMIGTQVGMEGWEDSIVRKSGALCTIGKIVWTNLCWIGMEVDTWEAKEEYVSSKLTWCEI